MLHSYRPLMRFWAAVLLFCGAGVVALEALGPPPSGASPSGAPVSGALMSAPVSPVREVAKAPVDPAEDASPAAEATAARAVVPVLPAAATAAVAGVPLSPPASAQSGPRKAAPPAPPKAATAQRGTLSGDAVGPRYGAADRRAPTRDIWGNPLLPPAGRWADRPPPAAGRGEGGYIGVFTVGPDGTRSFRAGP